MKYAIITDSVVKALYGDCLLYHLQTLKYPALLFSFPSGEQYKTRKTKENLENTLLSHGYRRDTLLIALGGGVVTDLVGFLASTFCRGVPYICIPTTLLAMVDATIGGKTGVNTSLGKNLIGTFYDPLKVILDLRYLKTLPMQEWWNGKVEMLKIALVADPEFFERFSDLSLQTSVERARQLKQQIVDQDRLEKSYKRQLLNFGHTIGHALETVSRYEISHGEAIATGILIEARLSYEMGFLSGYTLQRIEQKLSPRKFQYSAHEIWKALQYDKKRKEGVTPFVLLKNIGEAVVSADVSKKLILKVLHDTALLSC